MRSKSCLLASIMVLVLGVPTLASPPILDVGQPFPDITFSSAEDGTPMSIANFRGQKVILHVFASW